MWIILGPWSPQEVSLTLKVLKEQERARDRRTHEGPLPFTGPCKNALGLFMVFLLIDQHKAVL